jgi:hypothetical protein
VLPSAPLFSSGQQVASASVAAAAVAAAVDCCQRPLHSPQLLPSSLQELLSLLHLLHCPDLLCCWQQYRSLQ